MKVERNKERKDKICKSPFNLWFAPFITGELMWWKTWYKIMNNNKYPWYLNWFTIIMALYLFWPVGIALIILRTKRNKGGVFSGITNKKIYLITGALLVLFGFTRFDSSSTFALFMIAPFNTPKVCSIFNSFYYITSRYKI